MAGLAGKLIKIVFVKDKTTKYIELKKFSNGSDFMFEDILQSGETKLKSINKINKQN